MIAITFLKFWLPYMVEEINRKTQLTLSLSNDCLEKIRAQTASFTLLRKWESGLLLVSLAEFCTECWAKLGVEAHVRSEFRHVYITAQDISQSLAKLLRFPGSKDVECWKEAQVFTFSSLPPTTVIWDLSHSSTPFALLEYSLLRYNWL